MKKHFCLRALSVGLALISYHSFADQPVQQHYWVRISQTQQSCAAAAAAMGATFAQASGMPVVSAQCMGNSSLTAEGHSYGFYSIEITYTADAGAQIYTASLVDNSAMGSGFGAYDKMADCVSDLQQQASLFEKATGLAALATRCEPDNDSIEPKVDLKIDGVGTPAQTMMIAEVPTDTTSETEQDLENLIVNSGGTVARVANNAIYFYAKDAIDAHADTVNLFDSDASSKECSSEVDLAREIYVAAGATTAIASCISKAADPYVSLMVVHNAPSMLNQDYGATSPKYFSFDECMADRSRVVSEAMASWSAILGGLCVGRDGQYVVDLFSKL